MRKINAKTSTANVKNTIFCSGQYKIGKTTIKHSTHLVPFNFCVCRSIDKNL